ncbi:MAG: hypothetical protein ABSD75_14825 [Terriglobales bacterium]|jgi:hypothetical protein
MSDGELQILARQNSELTNVAQPALAAEISRRGWKPVPDDLPPAPIRERPAEPPGDGDSSYDEDRKLVELCTVWSLTDALQVQNLLETAGILFIMGAEGATAADAVSSNFVNGVSVRIMQVGLPWARQALMNYASVDDPTPKQEEALAELPVRCPKYNSTEIVFDRLIAEPSGLSSETAGQPLSKFQWTCDSCGHQWEDEGIVEDA